ncbi:uncharacterized protein K452DRAFT_263395 [Aplosporella prunicola CBS 121167]|uniref:Uncharacterized protein n=1 Tax=Aplosporella prunicola CBS 121167 TaxID=1176127 RepID=A0A6A6BSZ8_9PEZI|nr:uncharacterized protein K452DRAFT_263395 [Aplosporella prunicola CBS 121167]KAF2145957.1 hypothetical protein K452DRAFT_263395 [Aplosporella prunicola CBS 121167]
MPSPHHDRLSISRSHAEWVPEALRKTRAIPFTFLCFIFIAALEAVDQKIEENQGISTQNLNLVRLIRYIPTILAVSIGFLWKYLVGDLKKIVPWSRMSEKWATASDSILLNYIGNLELISVFTSAKRRHWAIFMGLVVGFLSGVLVTAANSLTYTDLSATVSEKADLEKSSRFEFNGTLLDTNGTLPLPFVQLGHYSRPYAAVAVEKLTGEQYSPWTSDNYAFESFNRGPGSSTGNKIIEAKVSSLATTWECHQLQYSSKRKNSGWDDFEFRANPGSVDKSGCSLPVVQNVTDFWHDSKAWLNLTACSKDHGDLRLLATIAYDTDTIDGVTHEPPVFPESTISGNNISMAGLICSPKFTIQNAVVQANEISGKVVNYMTDLSSAEDFDIQTPMEAIWVYLNNPTSARFQAAVLDVDPWTANPPITMDTIKTELGRLLNYNDDSFFTVLANGIVDEMMKGYLRNSTVFQTEVEWLASRTMAQVISAFTRVNETQPLKGSVTTIQPRIKVQHVSLRILQAFLAIIGISSILQATLLRPRTILKEDPGPIAATALTLAASGAPLEREFIPLSVSDNKSMQKRLAITRCKLETERVDHVPVIGLSTAPLPASQAVCSKTESGLEDASSPQDHAGWYPIALRAPAKAGIIIAFFIAMAVLAVLQGLSSKNHGICRNDVTSLTVVSYIVTLILVFLGWTSSGLDGAVRSATPYMSLRRGSKRQPLLFNFRDIPALWVPFKAITSKAGPAVAVSSLALICLPVIKIVAAGLYTTAYDTTSADIRINLDKGLLNDWSDIYRATDLDSLQERAAQFTEWINTPSLGLAQRPGILENLVFGDIHKLVNSDAARDTKPGDEIDLIAPAIAADVKCTSVAPSDFDALACFGTYYEDSYTFAFRCSNNHCNQTLDFSWDMNWYIPTLRGKMTPFAYEGEIFVNDTDLYVFLSDFSNVKGLMISEFPQECNETSGAVDPRTLNVSSPSLRAVACHRNLTQVDVNATFTQVTNSEINGSSVYSWRPSQFNHASIKYGYQYTLDETPLELDFRSQTSIPDIFNYGKAITTQQTPGLHSNSLWPSPGSSLNFFQLLAVYAEYTNKNISSLLDPDQLATAAEAMYTAYSTQMLTELRPLLGLTIKRWGSLDYVNGTILKRREYVQQDLHTTVVLEALLAAVLCCILWICFRFPSRSILPKDPDSIAARISFLANSSMVQRLREEHATRVADSNIWRSERAGLGWWRVQNAAADEQGQESAQQRGWRWGIDVGKEMVQQDWNHAPYEDEDPLHLGTGKPVLASSEGHTVLASSLHGNGNGDESSSSSSSSNGNGAPSPSPSWARSYSPIRQTRSLSASPSPPVSPMQGSLELHSIAQLSPTESMARPDSPAFSLSAAQRPR